MSEPDFSRVQWHKSSRSSASGQCVQVAHLDQTIAVRDSKNPRGPRLVFTRQAWKAFIHSVKDAGSSLV
jgi:hypothetical protein